MEELQKPDDDAPIDKGRKALTGYAKYTGVAFQMMAIISAAAYLGYKIDEYYKHEVQWVTALFCVLGVCLSIYQTIRSLKSEA